MTAPLGFCAQCGPVGSTTDDGRCANCGTTCTGPGADLAMRMYAALSEIAEDERPSYVIGNAYGEGYRDGMKRAAAKARKALGRP